MIDTAQFKKCALGTTAAIALGAAALAGFSEARAQTVGSAAPASSSTQTLKPIPQNQCNFVYNSATETLLKKGKNFISDETRAALVRFFVSKPETKVIDCAGPRDIPWVTETDFAFVMALGDFATLAYKGVDFRADYKFRPTERPVMRTSSRGEPGRAPGG